MALTDKQTDGQTSTQTDTIENDSTLAVRVCSKFITSKISDWTAINESHQFHLAYIHTFY